MASTVGDGFEIKPAEGSTPEKFTKPAVQGGAGAVIDLQDVVEW